MNTMTAHLETLEFTLPLVRGPLSESWRATRPVRCVAVAVTAPPVVWRPPVTREIEAMEEEPERWDGMS